MPRGFHAPAQGLSPPDRRRRGHYPLEPSPESVIISKNMLRPHSRMPVVRMARYHGRNCLKSL